MEFRPVWIACALMVAAQAAAGAEVLTVAQVETVTGLSGLSVKPAKYDKGGINFVTASGDMVVSLKNQAASVYEVWKSQPSLSDQVPVPGLGDDGLYSKTGRYVCFKKADRGICVTGMVAMPDQKPLISDAQLEKLARVAASHL